MTEKKDSQVEKIFLSTPTMHGEELYYVHEAFHTNWVAPLGKNVDEFEKEISDYLGVGYAAALSSGTAALHMAVKLAGIQRDDVVLCSDLTFAASVNPVSYEGGRQVFIDSERDTWNMDPRALQKAFEKYDGSTPDRPKPKAVILVHLYGTPAKMDELCDICRHYNVPIIEDAAESLSSTIHGRQTGTFGQWNALSFNGNKIITTSGGGMLLSDSETAVKKVRFWATQARDPAPWYQHSELGYNYRMSNVVAGIGRGQLRWLDEHRRLKKQIYHRYQEQLSSLPLQMNPYLPVSKPNFWLSCLLLNKDANVHHLDVRNALRSENIESRPIWKPMHMQPFYKGRDFITVENEAVSKDIFSRGLCLPSDIKMTEEEHQRVIDSIREAIGA